ncbi:hypothetical protein [Nocardia sp. CA-120079]|uniref:hypothetical protein n=1 Tax=Nocardia sp. CA-120079 TaxID=3239974 RepID=UPI003D975D95
MGIQVPAEEELPPSPHRDLVLAIHVLYSAAGKPAVRDISDYLDTRDDLDGNLGRQAISDVLRGSSLPRWRNLEALVRGLVALQRVGKFDTEDVITKIHTLWSLADGGAVLDIGISHFAPHFRRTINSTSPAIPPSEASPEDDRSVESTSSEPISGLLLRQEPLLRVWGQNQQPLDIFDRQIAREVLEKRDGNGQR